ncbi:MAG: fibronectin type III-like domain-contianing protein, partial [Alistipes sp.]|nr:fibronectin type III-like domain-contianing protein [Alistipes sp.]
VGAHREGQYPGIARNDGSGVTDQRYDEGLFVGYRYADKNRLAPLFPFGHGLSYTTFRYGKPAVDRTTMTADETLRITVPVTNTGTREGAEVVQLYIRDVKSSLPRPVKELKAFRKVTLQPGETQEVVFDIDREALCFFDDARHEWVAEPGRFEALVAASAADIRGKVVFELK